jgi:hypothetical protein
VLGPVSSAASRCRWKEAKTWHLGFSSLFAGTRNRDKFNMWAFAKGRNRRALVLDLSAVLSSNQKRAASRDRLGFKAVDVRF